MIIYCVDDEKLNRDELSSILNKIAKKEEVKIFDDPFDLLNEASKRIPDVVFLDINMPKMDGLALAKQLQLIYKKINIIFVTGYIEHSLEAYQMLASGYVMKPFDEEEIKKQLDNLRFEIRYKTKIYAQTFGEFSLLVNDKPVFFRLKRSKEILAYLIDRNGSDISRKEIDAILFEDGSFKRENQVTITKCVTSLIEDLKKVNAEEIFIKSRSGYSVDKSKFDSDLFRYLKGDKSLYHGEYMEQYSWGEDFKANHIE